MKNKLIVNLTLAFVKLTGILPALLFFKPKVYFKNKEKQGRRLKAPAILVSNHMSLMDFVLYLALFPLRTLRFLMAEVLFHKGKAFATFLYALGGIYVNRDTYDFGFVSNALQVLDDGGIIGVFPEGRLPVNGRSFPFTSSTAFIALRTDAPIIPVYTDGNYGLFRRTSVVIGEPIYLQSLVETGDDEATTLKKLTSYLEQEVRGLAAYIPSGKEHTNES